MHAGDKSGGGIGGKRARFRVVGIVADRELLPGDHWLPRGTSNSTRWISPLVSVQRTSMDVT
jgi:hypothetical protein